MKITLYILTFLLLFSCSKEETTFKLPSSDFSNYNLNEHKNDYVITVEQLSNTKYRIVDRDTIIVTLDSTLHSKIFNKKRDNYPTVLLNLDKNTSYSDFRQLTKEFRKSFKQIFVLNLKNNNAIRISLPPYIQTDNEYIDSILKGHGAPNNYNEFKPYIEQKKVLNLRVTNSEITLKDLQDNKILDFKEYALKNKKFIIFYEFDSDCNYQNYVDMTSFIKSVQKDIWKKEKNENNLTENEFRGKYLFIVEEKTHPNTG